MTTEPKATAEIQKLLEELTSLKPMLIQFNGDKQEFYPLPPECAGLLISYIRTLEKEKLKTIAIIKQERENTWKFYHECQQ